ncbi:MAG TPA: DUF5666 domain-containing protein [Nitrospira sp.]|nr:DUF5666 domain-containing protein [Nitrospira sp.]
MGQRKVRDLFAALTLFVVLASCSPGPQAGGGIGGTGRLTSVASGPITGFGSVFVSGTEYETTDTSMLIDGQSGSQHDLKQGMLVRVTARVSEGSGTNGPLRTADTLIYEDTVEGVVQSVTPTGSHLRVLGQSITITPATLIDARIPGGTVRNLVPGRDVLEISGFVMGDGIVRATLIDLKPLDAMTPTPDYQVKGLITHHKSEQRTFEIGALTVDYQNAVLQDLPHQAGGVWDGLLVDVIGKQVSSEGGSSSRFRLTATRVRIEGLGSSDSEDAVVEGFVTRVPKPGNFFLGNLQVVSNAETIFQGGTSADILTGVHLEVHGRLSGGILTATKVELEDADLQGAVTQVVSPGHFFLGNVQVFTSAETTFEGGTINDITAGVHLEVYGSVVDGTVSATKVEFERVTSLPETRLAATSAKHTLP